LDDVPTNVLEGLSVHLVTDVAELVASALEPATEVAVSGSAAA
jgi:ATP-dependent Lon protease